MATNKTSGTELAEGNNVITLPGPKDTKSMNLAQKFVELRKACPEIVKRKHSDGVKYTFAKIFDVYELLAPAMNTWGVDWDIVKEVATRHHENGDAKFYDCYTQQTRNGPRVVWVYEADITLRWINVDNPEETQEITLHALGTNDSGPDKAKGSAWTYCLKYYLFEKFNIDQGEDDPDMSDRTNEGQGGGYQAAPKQPERRTAALSDAQMKRLYEKAAAVGMTKETTDKRILKIYNQSNPALLTKEQYENICSQLDAAAAKTKEEQQNAE